MEGYHFENTTIIKIMVLFTVKHMNRPVSNVEITDLLGDYANYFLIARAVGELTETGLLSSEAGLLCLTEQGEVALSGFGSEIPFSVREKILLTLRSERQTEASKIEVLADVEKINEISYLASIGLKQGGETVLAVDINVGSRTTAEEIVKNFRRNSTETYDKILAVLLGGQDGGAL